MPPPFVRTDLGTRSRYSQGAGIYRIVPAAVARPATLAELRVALGLARDNGWGVTARGAGSAMGGDNVTRGLVLDLTAFETDRCTVDSAARRVSVSPGVSLTALNRAAAAAHLRLAVDPSSAGWATIGGLVSTNAAGPHSIRNGSMRRWVHRIGIETGDGPLELVRGEPTDAGHPVIARWQASVEPLLRRHRAEIRDRFPRVSKNSAGYALDRLLDSGELIDIVVGSEGTLGVITAVELDLEPIPSHRASLRVAVRDRADLVDCIAAVRKHDPATLELLDRSFLRLVAGRSVTPERPGLLDEAAGLLLADFEGNDAVETIGRATAAADSLRPTALDTSIATDAATVERLWSIRHGASPILAGLSDGRRSLQVIEDGCVPVSRLGEYLAAVDAAAQAARIDVVMFGHAGDGHVHVNLLPNLGDADWLERVRGVFEAVSSAVIRLGGTPSGEHGVGRLRAGLLARLYGPEVIECFRAVKRSFDPAGRFNPGVILGDGDPLADLKVGEGAAPLPAGVDEYLSAIERNAAWATSRWD